MKQLSKLLVEKIKDNVLPAPFVIGIPSVEFTFFAVK